MSRLTSSRVTSRGLVLTYLPLILLITALTAGSTVLLASMRPAEYVATAQVVVYPDPARTTVAGKVDMGTERELANSGVVAAGAAEILQTSPGEARRGLSVSVPVDANILNFAYTHRDRDTARERVAAFVDAYVTYRNKGHTTKQAEMITPAQVPLEPKKQQLPLLIGLGVVLGAMVGFAVALVWDRARGRLRDQADVIRHTGLAVMGSTPTRGRSLPMRPGQAPTTGDPSFGHLAAQLAALTERGRGASFVVTGASRDAGATTVAARLAVALAATGREVVLVGADLRHPDLQDLFGAPQAPGLTDVLAATADLEKAMQATGFRGLWLLPIGSAPEAGLAVDDLELLLRSLSGRAYVVLDTAMAAGAPETGLIASRADHVLLVIDARHGRRADAAAAVSTLRRVDADLIGCVLNSPLQRWMRWVGRRLSRPAPTAPAAEPEPTQAPAAAAPEEETGTTTGSPVTAGAAPDELPEPRLPEPEPEPEPEPAAEAAAAADEPEPAEAPSAGSPNGKTAAGGAASRREHAAT